VAMTTVEAYPVKRIRVRRRMAWGASSRQVPQRRWKRHRAGQGRQRETPAGLRRDEEAGDHHGGPLYPIGWSTEDALKPMVPVSPASVVPPA